MTSPTIFEMLYWVAKNGTTDDQLVIGGTLVFCALVMAVIFWAGSSNLKEVKAAEDSRAHRKVCLEDVLANPSAYAWVWVISGFSDCSEYCYLYAQKKGSTVRLDLAHIDEYTGAKAQLDERKIRVHSGPPGTHG